MKERPILFSGPMIQPITAGRKTQTRREINPQPYPGGEARLMADYGVGFTSGPVYGVASKYGIPGDRLFVKETWRVAKHHDGTKPSLLKPRSMTVQYKAGGHACNDVGGWTFFDEAPSGVEFGRWRPSIFMPRWASRITLEITVVRVERLQEISEVDAEAEGCPEAHLEHTEDCHHEHCALAGGVDDCCGYLVSAKLQYKALWESINGPGSWEANPFVWVVEFRRVK